MNVNRCSQNWHQFANVEEWRCLVDMMTYQWEFLSLVIESWSRWIVQWRHGIYVLKSDYCVENSDYAWCYDQVHCLCVYVFTRFSYDWCVGLMLFTDCIWADIKGHMNTTVRICWWALFCHFRTHLFVLADWFSFYNEILWYIAGVRVGDYWESWEGHRFEKSQVLCQKSMNFM